MKARKVLAFLLSMVLVISMLPLSLFAAETFIIDSVSITAKNGGSFSDPNNNVLEGIPQKDSEFYVFVHTSSFSGLAGADVRLNFNPDVLEVVDAVSDDTDPVTEGVQSTSDTEGIQAVDFNDEELHIRGLDDNMQPALITRNEADNMAGTIWYAASNSFADTTPGEKLLAKVKFRVKETIIDGTDIVFTGGYPQLRGALGTDDQPVQYQPENLYILQIRNTNNTEPDVYIDITNETSRYAESADNAPGGAEVNFTLSFNAVDVADLALAGVNANIHVRLEGRDNNDRFYENPDLTAIIDNNTVNVSFAGIQPGWYEVLAFLDIDGYHREARFNKILVDTANSKPALTHLRNWAESSFKNRFEIGFDGMNLNNLKVFDTLHPQGYYPASLVKDVYGEYITVANSTSWYSDNQEGTELRIEFEAVPGLSQIEPGSYKVFFGSDVWDQTVGYRVPDVEIFDVPFVGNYVNPGVLGVGQSGYTMEVEIRNIDRMDTNKTVVFDLYDIEKNYELIESVEVPAANMKDDSNTYGQMWATFSEKLPLDPTKVQLIIKYKNADDEYVDIPGGERFKLDVSDFQEIYGFVSDKNVPSSSYVFTFSGWNLKDTYNIKLKNGDNVINEATGIAPSTSGTELTVPMAFGNELAEGWYNIEVAGSDNFCSWFGFEVKKQQYDVYFKNLNIGGDNQQTLISESSSETDGKTGTTVDVVIGTREISDFNAVSAELWLEGRENTNLNYYSNEWLQKDWDQNDWDQSNKDITFNMANVQPGTYEAKVRVGYNGEDVYKNYYKIVVDTFGSIPVITSKDPRYSRAGDNEVWLELRGKNLEKLRDESFNNPVVELWKNDGTTYLIYASSEAGDPEDNWPGCEISEDGNYMKVQMRTIDGNSIPAGNYDIKVIDGDWSQVSVRCNEQVEILDQFFVENCRKPHILCAGASAFSFGIHAANLPASPEGITVELQYDNNGTIETWQASDVWLSYDNDNSTNWGWVKANFYDANNPLPAENVKLKVIVKKDGVNLAGTEGIDIEVTSDARIYGTDTEEFDPGLSTYNMSLLGWNLSKYSDYIIEIVKAQENGDLVLDNVLISITEKYDDQIYISLTPGSALEAGEYKIKVWGVEQNDNEVWIDECRFRIKAPEIINIGDKVTDPATGHDYAVCERFMSWDDMVALCEGLGGHLVTINSAAEQEFVYNLVKDMENGCWTIGATDRDEEGNWRWVTGEPMSYTNWGDGEPNNYNDEDYAAIFTPDGIWNDIQGTYRFIIEWDYIHFKNAPDTIGMLTPNTDDTTYDFKIVVAQNDENNSFADGDTAVVSITDIDNPQSVISGSTVIFNGKFLVSFTDVPFGRYSLEADVSYYDRSIDNNRSIKLIRYPILDFIADNPVITGIEKFNRTFPAGITQDWIWLYGNNLNKLDGKITKIKLVKENAVGGYDVFAEYDKQKNNYLEIQMRNNTPLGMALGFEWNAYDQKKGIPAGVYKILFETDYTVEVNGNTIDWDNYLTVPGTAEALDEPFLMGMVNPYVLGSVSANYAEGEYPTLKFEGYNLYKLDTSEITVKLVDPDDGSTAATSNNISVNMDQYDSKSRGWIVAKFNAGDIAAMNERYQVKIEYTSGDYAGTIVPGSDDLQVDVTASPVVYDVKSDKNYPSVTYNFDIKGWNLDVGNDRYSVELCNDRGEYITTVSGSNVVSTINSIKLSFSNGTTPLADGNYQLRVMAANDYYIGSGWFNVWTNATVSNIILPAASPVEKLQADGKYYADSFTIDVQVEGVNLSDEDMILPLAGNAPLTRAELVRYLTRSAGVYDANNVTNFIDVPAEYSADVASAAIAQYVSGASQTEFNPFGYVTRAEVCTILVRAKGYTETTTISFSDVPTDHWSYGFISRAVAAGIVQGYQDGTFRPDELVTREQFASLLKKENVYGVNAVTDGKLDAGIENKHKKYNPIGIEKDCVTNTIKYMFAGVEAGSYNVFTVISGNWFGEWNGFKQKLDVGTADGQAVLYEVYSRYVPEGAKKIEMEVYGWNLGAIDSISSVTASSPTIVKLVKDGVVYADSEISKDGAVWTDMWVDDNERLVVKLRAANETTGIPAGEYELEFENASWQQDYWNGGYSNRYKKLCATTEPILMGNVWQPVLEAGVADYALKLPYWNVTEAAGFNAKIFNRNGAVLAQSDAVTRIPDSQKPGQGVLEASFVNQPLPDMDDDYLIRVYDSTGKEMLNARDIWVRVTSKEVIYAIDPGEIQAGNSPITFTMYGVNLSGNYTFEMIKFEQQTEVPYGGTFTDPAVTGKEATVTYAPPSEGGFTEGDYHIKVKNSAGQEIEVYPKFHVFAQNIGSTIDISGPEMVIIPGSGTTEPTVVNYTAIVKDQYGNIIQGQNVTWSLDSSPDGVTINSQGQLTVTETALDGTAVVKASLGDISKTKNVSIIGVQSLGIIPEIAFNKTAYARGDIAEVSLKLKNIPTGAKTNSVTFELQYDAETFELATGNPDTDIIDGYITFTTKDDVGTGSVKTVQVMLANMNGDTYLEDDEIVFTAKFKVKQDASFGYKNFRLLPVNMLDTEFNTITINGGFSYNSDVEVSDIIPASVEGYLSLYIGDIGGGLNTLIKNNVSQSVINDTFSALKFTFKKDTADQGIELSGDQVFLKDKDGNLAKIDENMNLAAEIRFSTADFTPTILIINGCGYKSQTFSINLYSGAVVQIGTETNPVIIYPGDLGTVVSGVGLVMQQDDTVNNIDFSAWLKIYKENIAGTASDDNILMADMTKDGEINNIDYSLWLASYKKLLNLQ